jgi:hypothetical protein
MVVVVLGVLLQLLVLASDRPPMPVFMGRWLQLVGLHLMLLTLLLSMLPRKVRQPGLARAKILLLVLVGIDMRLVVRPLVVLVQLIALAGARLLLHVLVDTKL